ncbi:mastermind-like protein 2, partial [Oncorhynchus keta]|uniref:mastermind-like protein 2 n=1 Tax=Oncorhynchus keta TaxID=8018 RepID=UPI00227A149A
CGAARDLPGSAVPQLHSAIVERLRARIELCRRHHSTCENRYQRGQAENSDREHESTLHLLNIVHQGPGNRKTKGNRLRTNNLQTTAELMENRNARAPQRETRRSQHEYASMSLSLPSSPLSLSLPLS